MKNDLKLLFISLLISVFHSPVVATNENNTTDANNKVKNDLPSRKDLRVYLNVLDRISDFCFYNKEFMSISFVIGLTVENVNLRPFLKDVHLPKSLQNRLNHFVRRNNEILHYYFNYKLKKTLTNKIVRAIFNNETTWSKGILKLNLGLLNKTYSYNPKYPTWSRYQRAVDDITNTTPSRNQSNTCILSLANVDENPWYAKDVPLQCHVPMQCYKAITSGTNFGYALTHRFLLLMVARLSRACAIFSFKEDALVRKSLCETMYREAEFIASNDFKLPDLIFEQMALCSLDGHAQFLRKSWLTHLLRYQSSWGCFNIILPTSPIKHFQSLTSISRWSNFSRDILDKECDEHVTAVAGAALSGAIRLILENY